MTDIPRKRRRSAHVSTLLVGGAAMLALAGCGQEEPTTTEARLFNGLEACRAEFDPGQCESAFQQAQQLHRQSAPRFTNQAECEQQMGAGACQQQVVQQANGSTGSFFMPMLMGFMMARMMQPPMNPNGYVRGRDGSYYQSRPLHMDRDGFMRSGQQDLGRVDRDTFRNSSTGFGASVPAPGTRKATAPARTTSRGGFGGTSGRFSGGGS
ncbi:DUF1190 domain-containing protein [Niveispirillum sp. KHB5.9]|uniref:DUF1190 domain-containing protein n=1 Tax=Niveispirillum sp. KHB5.9 TaxID=3400269 RepID=UPI003A87A180